VAAQKIAQGKEAKAKPSKKAQSAKSDGFYSNWKWKKARYEAIKKYEQRCMCCGWQVGDTPHGYLVVDHIKPRSKYPNLELDVNNLQVLCNDCNMGKSNDSCDDWRSMNERFRSTIWL
jgi:predicted restriction endonuclease